MEVLKTYKDLELQTLEQPVTSKEDYIKNEEEEILPDIKFCFEVQA